MKPVVKPKSARKSRVKPPSAQTTPVPAVQESQPVLESAQRKEAFPVYSCGFLICILYNVSVVVVLQDVAIYIYSFPFEQLAR